jgi:hypothetical protein
VSKNLCFISRVDEILSRLPKTEVDRQKRKVATGTGCAPGWSILNNRERLNAPDPAETNKNVYWCLKRELLRRKNVRYEQGANGVSQRFFGAYDQSMSWQLLSWPS